MVNLCLNDIYKFYIYKKRTVCQKAANKKKAYIKHREDIPRSVRPYHVAFVNIDRWTCKPNRNGTCTLSLSLSISFPSLICIFASVQTATAKIITLLIHLTWTKQNSYFENFVIWSIFCAARQLSAIFTIGTIIRCVFVCIILCSLWSVQPTSTSYCKQANLPLYITLHARSNVLQMSTHKNNDEENNNNIRHIGI